MSETPDYTTETTPVVTSTAPVVETPAVVTERRSNRLYRALAWVGIVAGTVFIVAVVFFSGFILGRHAGGPGHFGHHRGHGQMMMDHGHGGRGFGDRGPGHGPGMWGGPGGTGGPGNPGPGGPGNPGEPPTPPAPPTR
jgi:hypothetical protein